MASLGKCRAWIVLLAMLAATGCISVPERSHWGESATLTPGWERVRDAAANAARDPYVWVPLAGAVVFQVGDWDQDVAHWAQREQPLFGSDAERWSDDLRSASSWAYVASVLVTPSGDHADDWFRNKARGVSVGLAARAATSQITQGMKRAIDRPRPDPDNTAGQSFPSGHTSASAVNTRLASRNLRWLELPPRTQRALDTGLLMLTVGTSWARIEAGAHYPSDTLVGMALGNFLAAFINDAFLGGPGAGPRVTVRRTPGGGEVRLHIAF